MKKCPNCNKPIPVGAKRCVHCRMPVEDHDGLGQGRSSYDNVGGGYGRASNIEPIDNGMYRNGRMGMGGNAGGQHHTMIGLGPIDAPSRQQNDIFDGGERQVVNTIAGMPGVSANMTRQQLMEAEQAYRSSSTPSMNAISGSFNPARTSGIKEPIDLPDFSAPARSSGSRRPVSSAGFKPAGISSGMEPVVAFKPSISSSDAKPVPITDNKPAATTAPSSASVPPAEDPLAGMDGVSAAPVPSSLVDEEFTDLTSKLFGEDFAAMNNTTVDEDGWDFDFDTPEEGSAEAAAPAPKDAKPAEAVAEPVPSVAKSAASAPAPLSISSPENKKVEKEPRKPVEEKIESKTPEEKTVPRKQEERVEPAPAPAQTQQPAKQSVPVLPIVLVAIAVVTGVGAKLAGISGTPLTIIFIVVLGLLACAVFFFLKKK